MYRLSGTAACAIAACGVRKCSTKPPVKVDIELIKELRFQTEAPLKDCKEALTQVLKEGAAMSVDEVKKAAIVLLHAKGVSRAAGKRERVTDFGVLVACQSPSADVAAIVQLCCETDFSAGNSRFSTLGDSVSTEAQCVLGDMAAEVEAIRGAWIGQLGGEQKDAAFDVTDAERAIIEKISEKCAASIAATSHALGENITIKRCFILPAAKTVETESTEGVRFTSSLRVGVYAHSATVGVSRFVGKAVGVIGIHVPTGESKAPPVTSEALVDLAQHCVANIGDTSKHVTLQQFEAVEGAGDQSPTVNKWLRGHGAKYAASMVAEFGKQPIVSLPIAIPTQFQKGKPQQ